MPDIITQKPQYIIEKLVNQLFNGFQMMWKKYHEL